MRRGTVGRRPIVVFPFFLFIVGAAIPFSRRGTAGQALRRGAVLLALGLFMPPIPTFDLSTLRIPGVLQRIAVCYVAAWLVHRLRRPWAEAAMAGGLMAAYWFLMTRVTVPGGLPPNLEPETNLGAWLDRTLMSGHLWRQSKTWDPEGVLSTLPAIATTLLGVLAGRWVKRDAPAPAIRAAELMGTGLGLDRGRIGLGPDVPHQQEPVDAVVRPADRGPRRRISWARSSGSPTSVDTPVGRARS